MSHRRGWCSPMGLVLRVRRGVVGRGSREVHNQVCRVGDRGRESRDDLVRRDEHHILRDPRIRVGRDVHRRDRDVRNGVCPRCQIQSRRDLRHYRCHCLWRYRRLPCPGDYCHDESAHHGADEVLESQVQVEGYAGHGEAILQGHQRLGGPMTKGQKVEVGSRGLHRARVRCHDPGGLD